MIDEDFIKKVEAAHFRTRTDTGANTNALLIWNLVRAHVGLSKLEIDDLAAFCTSHRTYHVIRADYGCIEQQPEKKTDVA